MTRRLMEINFGKGDMMMKFTEAKLEQGFTELLGNEGYPHFVGNSIYRIEDEVLRNKNYGNLN